jgi:hypothetical protein
LKSKDNFLLTTFTVGSNNDNIKHTFFEREGGPGVALWDTAAGFRALPFADLLVGGSTDSVCWGSLRTCSFKELGTFIPLAFASCSMSAKSTGKELRY